VGRCECSNARACRPPEFPATRYQTTSAARGDSAKSDSKLEAARTSKAPYATSGVTPVCWFSQPPTAQPQVRLSSDNRNRSGHRARHRLT
jgi:hypothetical protein